MTRFLSPLAFAARRNQSGDHLRIRSDAAGSQRDVVVVAPRADRSAGRARLTNFRRAIQG
ncbi:hypothetical protein [Nioella aestuarii]|uniref:hypothetical protein n=1 Tax=Nioella aestuarii TaxID=1662864 RepID=UPI003D7FAD5F